MNARERVMCALRGEVPDRVPYCELGVDRALANRLLGWSEPASQAADLEANPYTIDEALAIAQELRLNNLTYVLRAPVYAERIAGEDGRLFYGEGQIRTRADLDRVQLPDPYDDRLYEQAALFAERKGDYAAWFVTRMGISSTMLSMGTEHFCLSLYDDRPLIEELLDRYCEWAVVVAGRACRLGFDVFVTTDDMAFNTAPFFSPRVLRELVMPRFRRLAEVVSLPWVLHSDGNIMPFVPDLLELGIAGLHPLEKGAMDVAAVKREYGDRICLLGNVDLNILGMGSEEDVVREVRELIRVAGPGGGYIVTSGNSLAGYLKPENVRALSAAVWEFGGYS
jgi:uroporphyrinogen-III decarboxylase